ncbi:hypothetical protein HYV80_01700 [Candidatus Woesearchaeota archaeon]|nr:hypothetical protein [Candidatus Woesearchaeota archaeon]
MPAVQNTDSIRHFARHLFLVSKAYASRKKAAEDVDEHLRRMGKSIVRMSLSYSDISRLKQKIDALIGWERKYAKLFRPEDKETEELKSHIAALEQELRNEKEEKYSIISENNEKIAQLTESLSGIKDQMKHLHLEKARRQQRMQALDKKINEKIDLHRYYHS